MSSWEWPESLVQEVAERRAVFVVGAGASMSCKSATGAKPPSWRELIDKLSAAVQGQQEKRAIKDNLRTGRLLEAAEIIQDALPPSELDRILRAELLTPNYEPSEVHKTIIQIDPKIIITPNYDDMFEKLVIRGPSSGGYVVCRHTDDHAVNDLRSGQRCIFKMHGCIGNPSKIVLSKTSYFKARRDNSSFFAVLDSLFLTSTLIFVGTSMDDPDLQIMLENANISCPSDYPHYAIMEKHKHAIRKKILRENFNVQTVEYPRGRHDYMVEMLRSLSQKVDEWRSVH